MVKRGKKKKKDLKNSWGFFFFSSTIRNNLIKSEEVRKDTKKKILYTSWIVYPKGNFTAESRAYNKCISHWNSVMRFREGGEKRGGRSWRVVKFRYLKRLLERGERGGELDWK